MTDLLKNHINKFATVSDDEFSKIIAYFETVKAAKKENLMAEGQRCKYNYFVLKGILRKFFINDKGIEQTTEFAIESWWMTDNFAFIEQSETEFFIQAVEKCEVLSISKEKMDKLLKEHPLMEKYFRCVYQKAYVATQMRLKFLHNYSREELYYHFRDSQPAFLQRVPQYLVASYLGFTPEYLSEIRKKNIS
jgi:CRP-like cAMP-binding protein